jgi:hypothetical protein
LWSLIGPFLNFILSTNRERKMRSMSRQIIRSGPCNRDGWRHESSMLACRYIRGNEDRSACTGRWCVRRERRCSISKSKDSTPTLLVGPVYGCIITVR